MKCSDGIGNHFGALDINHSTGFLTFYIFGWLYLILAAFIFNMAISICRHKKKNLQRYYIVFYGAFITTVLIRGIGFMLYIFDLDFKTKKAARNPAISYIVINFFSDIPVVFENIATVIFVCILQYILQLWDGSRRKTYQEYLKRLIGFLIFQFVVALILFFVSAYACMGSNVFFTFYVFIDMAIILIVLWGGFPFISYLKINWPHLYATIRLRLWSPLICGLVAILGRLVIACLNIFKVLDDFSNSSKKKANDYNYPIFVFFYIFIVEVFPILCFGVFLNVQKQRITGNSQGGQPSKSFLDEDQGKYLLDELSSTKSTSMERKGRKQSEFAKQASLPPAYEYGYRNLTVHSKLDKGIFATSSQNLGSYLHQPPDQNIHRSRIDSENIYNRPRRGSDPNDTRKKHKY